MLIAGQGTGIFILVFTNYTVLHISAGLPVRSPSEIKIQFIYECLWGQVFNE